MQNKSLCQTSPRFWSCQRRQVWARRSSPSLEHHFFLVFTARGWACVKAGEVTVFGWYLVGVSSPTAEMTKHREHAERPVRAGSCLPPTNTVLLSCLWHPLPLRPNNWGMKSHFPQRKVDAPFVPPKIQAEQRVGGKQNRSPQRAGERHWETLFQTHGSYDIDAFSMRKPIYKWMTVT